MRGVQALNAALGLVRKDADTAILITAIGMIGLVGLSGALAASTPLALKTLVDAVAQGAPAHTLSTGSLMTSAAAYILVLCASRVSSDVRPLLSARIEQHVSAAIRERSLGHLLRLPSAFFINRRSGELLHSVDLAAAGAQVMVAHLTNSIAPVLVELATMTVILVHLGQPALVVLFATTAAAHLAIFSVGAARIRQPARDASSASMATHAHLSDGVAHAEMLRCFGAEASALNSLHAAASVLKHRWIRLNMLGVQTALCASVVFALALTACLAMSLEAVRDGRMTVGGFLLASTYLLQMVRPLEILGNAARDLSRTLGFIQPLLDILAEPPEHDTPDIGNVAHAPRPITAPSIRLEELHFSYSAGSPILRGLVLDLPGGQTTAIVGRSGSGKSSLIRLLLRLQSPQAGRILIDGSPIETWSLADLRSAIGLVPQEATPLHASAADNIALGKPSATRDEIVAAACGARIHDRIKALPHGYDTLLGERGLTLSGGERQRIAIARAIIRRPSIYLLDEPTSMLDTKTESDILTSLRTLTAGCTTVLVAHRLSTVVHADKIVVLDEGTVAEEGTHETLLARRGIYAQLWQQQAIDVKFVA